MGFSTTRLDRDRADAIVDFSRLALSDCSLEDLHGRATALLRDRLGAPIAEFMGYRRDLAAFAPEPVDGPGAAPTALHRIGLESALGKSISNGAAICDDLRSDDRFVDLRDLTERGMRSALFALAGSAERPHGALAVFAAQPNAFSRDDAYLAESIGALVGDAAKRRRSTRRTVDVLESIADGFCAFDANLNMTYVNRRLADSFGLTPELMLGRNATEFANVPSNLEHMRTALRCKEQVTYETYSPQFDRWYDVHVYPAGDGISVYSRDITARKTAELRVRELNAELETRVAERTAQLEEANRDLESFAYSISHDLRAPLRAIDGFGKALEEECFEALDEAGRSYLGRVRAASGRMANLIDSMLALAKVAAHAIVPRPVDLSSVARSIAADLAEAEPTREVAFEVVPGLIAWGDATLLRAVLENLIGNAWKFTRNVTQARVCVGRNPATGEIFVRDNGAGFDMNYAGKLFGAFQRLHSVQEYEGTGIGLASVARIVHRHGGGLRAEGSLGEGATFYFSVPDAPAS